MILGTAAYMAPEQARGKAVDKRADIWAFGVVLFEMLTGRRLFEGETISDTLAAVLTKDVGLVAAAAGNAAVDSATAAPLSRARSDAAAARHRRGACLLSDTPALMAPSARNDRPTRSRAFWPALTAAMALSAAAGFRGPGAPAACRRTRWRARLRS